MRTVVVHCIRAVRPVNTKYGPKVVAEIEIQGEAKREFWLSPKQGQKLGDCYDIMQRHGGYSTKHAECHLVLDDQSERGERFVWCGLHTPRSSDLAWLEKQFGVACESPYIGRYDRELPPVVDSSLKDD